jgi:hypothetical protein
MPASLSLFESIANFLLGRFTQVRQLRDAVTCAADATSHERDTNLHFDGESCFFLPIEPR